MGDGAGLVLPWSVNLFFVVGMILVLCPCVFVVFLFSILVVFVAFVDGGFAVGIFDEIVVLSSGLVCVWGESLEIVVGVVSVAVTFGGVFTFGDVALSVVVVDFGVFGVIMGCSLVDIVEGSVVDSDTGLVMVDLVVAAVFSGSKVVFDEDAGTVITVLCVAGCFVLCAVSVELNVVGFVVG